eukprot:1196229-Prorocentrum_minimum.AAC.6
MRYQLFLCFLSPVEELFPDLCMSWWTPPSLKLERYARLWPGRVASILTVWTPILSVVAQIMTVPEGPVITSLLTVSIFSAFAIRLGGMGSKLKKIFDSPEYKALNLPNGEKLGKVPPEPSGGPGEGISPELKTPASADLKSSIVGLPRGSSEVRRLLKSTYGYLVQVGDRSFEVLEVAEIMYFFVFGSIAVIVYTALDDAKWLAFVAVGTLLTGAFFMAQFRHRHQLLDIFGRVVFTTGFLLNLYNLNRAENKVD